MADIPSNVTLSATNADILNAVRLNASAEYQQRIPAATQGNIAESLETLNAYPNLWNEFLGNLINRIGLVVYRSKAQWESPLRDFKIGALNYGETIEEIATNLLKAKSYNASESYEDVFKLNKPEMYANFHSINRQDYYELSINEDILKRAFMDEYGLQSAVSMLMDAPYNSDNWDEYLCMKRLFKTYDDKQGFFKIHVSDPATETVKGAADTELVKAVRTYVGKLRFMSTLYNGMGIYTHSMVEDLRLFITPETQASIDVDVMAAAFNMGKVEFLSKIVVVDDFNMPGVRAILADKDFFVCADNKIQFSSQWNPKGLYWNYWLHHWEILSCSTFVNAIAFTTGEGTNVTAPVVTVTAVALSFADATITKVAKGESVQLSALVTGTIVPATAGYSVPQSVEYSITKCAAPLGEHTAVDENGVLTIDPEETNTTITVKAVSTWADVSATLDVTIG